MRTRRIHGQPVFLAVRDDGDVKGVPWSGRPATCGALTLWEACARFRSGSRGARVRQEFGNNVAQFCAESNDRGNFRAFGSGSGRRLTTGMDRRP